MANRSKQDIVAGLHARGLRKRVAKSVAGALDAGTAKRPPAHVARVADELRSLARELEDRASARTKKRREAARKAARTRAANAEKRSAAARKAGRKRSGQSPRGKRRAR